MSNLFDKPPQPKVVTKYYNKKFKQKNGTYKTYLCRDTKTLKGYSTRGKPKLTKTKLFELINKNKENKKAIDKIYEYAFLIINNDSLYK